MTPPPFAGSYMTPINGVPTARRGNRGKGPASWRPSKMVTAISASDAGAILAPKVMCRANTPRHRVTMAILTTTMISGAADAAASEGITMRAA